MNDHALKRAAAAFKKDQRATEASLAWREYEASQAAVNANMMRLRALRLAREAASLSSRAKSKNRRP
jgi:hypothetical protein